MPGTRPRPAAGPPPGTDRFEPLRIRDVAAAAEQSTMGVYTHFGSKQGLLEQLYLHGFRRLEERLNSVPSDGQGRQELLAFALAYRGFALDNEALYGLMFERATPDFVPSDASRLAGLATFEMLATRVAECMEGENCQGDSTVGGEVDGGEGGENHREVVGL